MKNRLLASGIFIGIAFLIGIAQLVGERRGPIHNELCRARSSNLPLLSQLATGGDTELKSFLGAIPDSWTTDYLITLALEVQRQWIPHCDSGAAQGFLRKIKTAYLQRLGLKPAAAAKVDPAFALFIGNKTERERIESILRTAPDESLDAVAERVYGKFGYLRGVPILGVESWKLPAIEMVLGKMCGARSPCPFWDPRNLLQVRFTPDPAMASYVPRLGTLVLSRSLIDAPNFLTQIVIGHELAHAAIRSFEWQKDQTLVDSFAVKFGWKRDGEGWTPPATKRIGKREDAVTRYSKDSDFSVIPDDVLVTDTADRDGVLFAKSIRAARVEEDLADTIAAYQLLLERFCFEKKPFAPARFAWVAKEVFKENRMLGCDGTLMFGGGAVPPK